MICRLKEWFPVCSRSLCLSEINADFNNHRVDLTAMEACQVFKHGFENFGIYKAVGKNIIYIVSTVAANVMSEVY